MIKISGSITICTRPRWWASICVTGCFTTGDGSWVEASAKLRATASKEQIVSLHESARDHIVEFRRLQARAYPAEGLVFQSLSGARLQSGNRPSLVHPSGDFPEAAFGQRRVGNPTPSPPPLPQAFLPAELQVFEPALRETAGGGMGYAENWT